MRAARRVNDTFRRIKTRGATRTHSRVLETNINIVATTPGFVTPERFVNRSTVIFPSLRRLDDRAPVKARS